MAQPEAPDYYGPQGPYGSQGQQGAPQYGHPQHGPPPQYGPPQYGPPQYGPPGYGAPQYSYGGPPTPPPPPRPKRPLGLILGVSAAVIVLILVAAGVLGAVLLTGGPDGKGTTAAKRSSAPPPAATTGPEAQSTAPTSGNTVLNHTIRQKDLEITVTGKPRCGVKTLGSGALAGQTEKGQFCLVDLKFRNIGKRALKPNNDASLIDKAGGTYYVDFDSDAVNPGEKLTLYDNIYPGKTATGIIAFDLPADQTPATLTMNPVGDFTDKIQVDLTQGG